MNSNVDFAILAAVPEVHLRSALDTCMQHGYVAFGVGNTVSAFEKADDLRAEQRVPVLIYASHGSRAASEVYEVSWLGWYTGHVAGKGGQHPQGMKHRPDSAATDGAWPYFWHVEGLQELRADRRIPVSSLEKFGKRGEFRANARVRAPALVQRPSDI